MLSQIWGIFSSFSFSSFFSVRPPLDLNPNPNSCLVAQIPTWRPKSQPGGQNPSSMNRTVHQKLKFQIVQKQPGPDKHCFVQARTHISGTWCVGRSRHIFSGSVHLSVGWSVCHIFEFRAVFALLLQPNHPRFDYRVSSLVELQTHLAIMPPPICPGQRGSVNGLAEYGAQSTAFITNKLLSQLFIYGKIVQLSFNCYLYPLNKRNCS